MQPLTWLVKLVVYGLAVFRLARPISVEDGPADLFEIVRQRCGVCTEIKLNTSEIAYELNPLTNEWDSKYVEIVEEVAETPLARFITCPLCVSAWLALPAVASLWLEWLFGDIVASWLAIASITVILHRDD